MTWSVPDRFIMSISRGRCGTVNIHPVFKLINQKALPAGKLTRDSRGKGFAVRRLNKHNFCPASAYTKNPNLSCIEDQFTKPRPDFQAK